MRRMAAAACEPGISASKLAREHGVIANMLFIWRRRRSCRPLRLTRMSWSGSWWNRQLVLAGEWANGRRVPGSSGAHRCDQAVRTADAAYLAQPLRLSLPLEGYICPREQLAARDLARKRIELVRCRAAEIRAIENLFARHMGESISSRLLKRVTAEQVNTTGPPRTSPSRSRLILRSTIAYNNRLRSSRSGYPNASGYEPEFRSLKTVPGIGENAGGHHHPRDRNAPMSAIA